MTKVFCMSPTWPEIKVLSRTACDKQMYTTSPKHVCLFRTTSCVSRFCPACIPTICLRCHGYWWLKYGITPTEVFCHPPVYIFESLIKKYSIQKKNPCLFFLQKTKHPGGLLFVICSPITYDWFLRDHVSFLIFFSSCTHQVKIKTSFEDCSRAVTDI